MAYNNNYQGGNGYQQNGGNNGGNGKRQNLGSLWQRTDKNGHMMLTGTINGQRVIIFANGFKNKETSPDFIVYKSEDFTGNGGQRQYNNSGRQQYNNGVQQYNNGRQQYTAPQRSQYDIAPKQTQQIPNVNTQAPVQQTQNVQAQTNNTVDINNFADASDEKPFPAF